MVSQLSRESLLNGQWRDTSCENGKFVLCEKELWSMQEMQQNFLLLRVLQEQQLNVTRLTDTVQEQQINLARLTDSVQEMHIDIMNHAKNLLEQEIQLTLITDSLLEVQMSVIQHTDALKEQEINITRLTDGLQEMQTDIIKHGNNMKEQELNIAKLTDSLHEVELNIVGHTENLQVHQKNITSLTENPVPLGFIYVQLKGQPEPSTTWPQVTWTEVSKDYEGLFFRVVGGKAAAFGTIQAESSPRFQQVRHHFSQDMCGTGVKAISPGTESVCIRTGAGVTDANVSNGLSFLVNNVEVKPTNTAMRIWKRTG